ncbi:bifunctional apoptosis regulator-like isoform X2 [Engraulis encrasicolus]|uniref:bifunctional apoptosis regulator-like isoform X2 n=1 Tax=Engraulis encrasicolus TaxID=184585 RepID=UPI002FD11916
MKGTDTDDDMFADTEEEEEEEHLFPSSSSSSSVTPTPAVMTLKSGDDGDSDIRRRVSGGDDGTGAGGGTAGGAAGGGITEREFSCHCCYDVLVEPTTLNCGHSFCRHCLAQWWESSHKTECPECREKWEGFPRVNILLRDAVEKLFPEQVRQRREQIHANPRVAHSVLAFQRHGDEQANRGATNGAQRRGAGGFFSGVLTALSAVAVILLVCHWGSREGVQELLVSKPVSSWSPEDVTLWLEHLGPWASLYQESFHTEQVNGRLLDEKKLSRPPLNVPNQAHRYTATTETAKVHASKLSKARQNPVFHSGSAAVNRMLKKKKKLSRPPLNVPYWAHQYTATTTTTTAATTTTTTTATITTAAAKVDASELSKARQNSVSHSDSAAAVNRLLTLLDEEELSRPPFSVLNQAHRRAILEELQRVRELGVKPPQNLWEYKAVNGGKSLFLLYALKSSPRLTMLYLYLFDYEAIFRPFIHTCCPVQRLQKSLDGRPAKTPDEDPNWKQWAEFLVKYALLPYQLLAEFAWDWLGVHYWTSRFVIVNAMLLSVLEGCAFWRLWSRAEIRTLPKKMWSHFWKMLSQGLAFLLLWPLVPQFVANCLFYWALYFNPIINIDLVVQQLRHPDTQVP